jgi:catalase
VIDPEEAIERLGRRFGVHAGMRALHARGVFCAGTFRASPEAGTLSRAAHMQEPEVPVLARLSNGSGNPDEPDAAPDVRGLAVSFELPGGSRTDVVSQSAPRFPVRTPDEFMALIEATTPGPRLAVRLPLFLLRHPRVAPALRANSGALKAPVGYGDMHYYAVHAYRWIDADGGSRWIRYRWLPAGEPARRREGKRGARYLSEELADRLPEHPVRFDLELQIAGQGDDPHDPSAVWPADRARVIAGRLELTEIVEGQDGIIFDPLRLTDGIEASEDPILHFRPRAYAVSYDRRTGAAQRPPWAR